MKFKFLKFFFSYKIFLINFKKIIKINFKNFDIYNITYYITLVYLILIHRVNFFYTKIHPIFCIHISDFKSYFDL